MAVDVSAASHADLVKEVNTLRESLDQTQHALGEAQSRLTKLEGNYARLQMMQTRQTRVEVQLDLLIRMQHPLATPMYEVPAPSRQHETDPGTA